MLLVKTATVSNFDRPKPPFFFYEFSHWRAHVPDLDRPLTNRFAQKMRLVEPPATVSNFELQNLHELEKRPIQ